MRRIGSIAVIALVLVALVGTTVSARPTPSISGRAGVGAQGGSMLITAKVRHAAKRAPFSAVAEVYFAGSIDDPLVVPVDVELKRAGRSFVARTRVSVPDDQAVGPVDVRIVITYGVDPAVQEVTIVTTGRIVAAEEEDAPPAP